MKPGDRLIAALVGEHEVGEVFTAWPLHVTVVTWFSSELASSEIAEKLSTALEGIGPFTACMGEEARLGYQGRAIVNLVVRPTPFTEINARVARVLEKSGAQLLGGRGTWGQAFIPHVTVQGNDRLQPDDLVVVGRLYIISQHGAFKRIDAEVRLHA